MNFSNIINNHINQNYSRQQTYSTVAESNISEFDNNFRQSEPFFFRNLSNNLQENLSENFAQFNIEQSNETTPINYALLIDGTEDTYNAFLMLKTDFLKKIDFLNNILLYDSIEDENFNFKFQKDTVEFKYNTLFRTSFPHKNFTFTKVAFNPQKFNSYFEHIFSLLTIYAKKADFYFFGFNALKSPFCKTIFQENAIDFLLKNSIKPFFFIKELQLRKFHRNFRHKYLIIIDNEIPKSLILLDIFKVLINTNLDSIKILNLKAIDVRTDFMKTKVQNKIIEIGFPLNSVEYGIFEYETDKKEKKSKQLNEYINFTEGFDFSFVCFYNFVNKYKIEEKNSFIFKVIKRARCNICVYNDFN
jgi:hypothetical protein